ncbi:MAG: helix-turn-helix domain-containing protein [Candidatus Woesebacteria bacterium]|jgi:excisionase family DNA binding protein
MDEDKKTKGLMSIGDSSEYLGVSIDTLRRWEKRGRIDAFRSPGGHRYFKKDDLDKLFGKKYTRIDDNNDKDKDEKKDKQQDEKPTPPTEDEKLSTQPIPPEDMPYTSAASKTSIPQVNQDQSQPQQQYKVAEASEEDTGHDETLRQQGLSKQQSQRLEDILKDSSKTQSKRSKKKFTIPTNVIIIVLIVFAIVDIILVYVWSSSNRMISPIP